MKRADKINRLRNSGVVVSKTGGAIKAIDLIVNSAKAKADLNIIQRIKNRALMENMERGNYE